MDSHIFKNPKDEKYKRALILIWSCFFALLIMQGTKNIYNAEIVAIQEFFGKTKAEASLAMTYYFIVYAIVQIILSPFFNKINLKLFLTVTMSLSAIMFVLMSFAPNMLMLYIICAINGGLQAGGYSGFMAIISKYVPVKLLPFANKIMNASSACYGVISYAVPVYFVAIGRWDLPFLIMGIVFMISILFFFISAHRLRKFPSEIKRIEKKQDQKEERPYLAIVTTKDKVIYFVVMMLTNFFSNASFYLIMNWVPSLLIENFGMPQEFSILITLLVPIVMFLCSNFAIGYCEKFSNLFRIGFVFAIISFATCFIMIFFFKVNIILTLISVILLLSFGSGSRVTFGSVLALKMRNQVNTGAYLSILNAMASIAAGIMPPIAGTIIDSLGYGTLFIAVALSTIISAISLLIYSKKIDKQRKLNG